MTYEGLDYRYVQAIQTVSEGRQWLETIVEANEAGDDSTYDTAVDELEAVEDVQHLARANAAGHTLAARFGDQEFEEVLGDIDHAGSIVEGGHPGGTVTAVDLLQTVKVERHVHVGGGQVRS